jgi:uncharacterized membrane protein
MQPNKVLRADAREQLRGVWKKIAFISFIYFLIFLPFYAIVILSAIFKYSVTVSLLRILSDPILVIIAGPFSLSLAGLFLRRICGEEFSLKNIFDGFRGGFPKFDKSFFLTLLIFIRTYFWVLLFIIPGIIKGISYSMAFYILYDNPDMKSRQALQESIRIMKGNKGKFFGLCLSFTGWMLLGVVSLGIGFFWIFPYISMTLAHFYENIKTSGGSKNNVGRECLQEG